MLFFTSFGFESPIVSQKLKELIENPFEKSVLIIPFAGFNSRLAGEKQFDALVSFGFKPENITVLSKGDDIKVLPDYIYVPGGDTFKLLYTIKKYGYLEKIKKLITSGSNYIGASAGAYITAKSIDYVKLLESDELGLSDLLALGIIDGAVLCHYDRHTLSEVLAVRQLVGEKIITIKNDEVFVVQ